MNTENLPTNELKKYGIMNEDNSFHKKLSDNDLKEFLNGKIMIVENENKRISFQLSKDKQDLNVNYYHLEKSIDNIINNAKEKPLQFIVEKELNTEKENLNFKAFLLDEKENVVKEYDFINNNEELTIKISERNNPEEFNRYRIELLKMKSYLQDKIDQYPEIAKDIEENLNIVEKTINIVSVGHSEDKEIEEKQRNTTVRLDVNDPDLYQDANRQREEDFDEEQEQEQEQKNERRRGFRR